MNLYFMVVLKLFPQTNSLLNYAFYNCANIKSEYMDLFIIDKVTGCLLISRSAVLFIHTSCHQV